ncbi:PREDICTED: juvenile hormone acid O-methyltransferase-like [Atta colombica]|uniref:juvenile hormone acid O-methyltransferase-like n=1 Tax=Atta colombica TaxID=520822 RepID=UPI00084CE4EC|nr:PREDICTED: juvenile hormone acid O-methyltransferase-like [Atta colombica]
MVNPAKYISSNEMQKCIISRVIKEFIKNLKSISGICMDVGCGPGDITNNILLPSLDLNSVIIGTDIQMTMIEYAKKVYSHNTRLKFEMLDIQTKNLPEKYISKFNHIFSFFTLHWCNELRKVFENIYCMLQPGGTMLILFPIHHVIFDVLKNIAHNFRFAPYLQNLNKYIPLFYNLALPNEDLKDLLESIGFNVQHCKLWEDFFDINTDVFLS